jgi:hypothetical protein
MAPGYRSIDVMEDNSGLLGGIVKADENYVGGKGATVVTARRSCGLDFRFASCVQVLGALAERHPPAPGIVRTTDGMVAAWPLPSSNYA